MTVYHRTSSTTQCLPAGDAADPGPMETGRLPAGFPSKLSRREFPTAALSQLQAGHRDS